MKGSKEELPTQVDLWVETGIPQWRISLIERGVEPKPEEAHRIAEALSCRLDDVFHKRVECQVGGVTAKKEGQL